MTSWDPSSTRRATRWLLLLIHVIAASIVVLSAYRVLVGQQDQWFGILTGVFAWLVVQYGFVKGGEHAVNQVMRWGPLEVVQICGVLLVVYRSAMDKRKNSTGTKE